MLRTNRNYARLFSSISKVLSFKRNSKESSKADILKAINLLNSKVSLFKDEYISETDRNNYIKQFTSALNEDLKDNKQVETHFEQSILGLNSLLKAQKKGLIDFNNELDIRQHILKIKNNEQELLNTFELLLHNKALSLENFRLVLINLKRAQSLHDILDSLEFYKEFDLYKILITTRALMFKDLALAIRIYDNNIETWLSLNQNEYSLFNQSRLLQKSLYQIVYKIKQDLSLLIPHQLTPSKYITLIESLPSQVNIIRKPNNLTKNQQLLVKFMEYLTTKPKEKQSLRRLIRLSVQNKVYQEAEMINEKKDVSLLNYRFSNGLNDLIEEMSEVYDDKETMQLYKLLHKGNDASNTVTVLKVV